MRGADPNWIECLAKLDVNIDDSFLVIFFTSVWNRTWTTQKIKIFIKDFFSKCDQISRKLRIWSHLLKKLLMENFIFCAVLLFLFCYLRQSAVLFERLLKLILYLVLEEHKKFRRFIPKRFLKIIFLQKSSINSKRQL